MAKTRGTERVSATYEHGALHPERPLALAEGEHVELILVRRADPARWDATRMGEQAHEDRDLPAAGLGAWADELDRIDRS